MDKNLNLDDYLQCSEYQAQKPGDDGFARFDKDGSFFFAMFDEDLLVFRSEAYSSESGRDNGILSVIKNRDLEERYSTKQNTDGKWVLVLKAGNHQEIAHSCPFDSEAEVLALMPAEREKAKAAKLASAKKPSSDSEDDYLICREYKERVLDSKSKDYPDFITFQHENGEYYFAWVNDEEVLMRSEGYPTEAPRNNGMQSVIKNRDIEERYKLIESHGAYFMTLKAGNHQEIARSCPYKTEAAALALLPSERAKVAAAKMAVAKVSPSMDQDDYLICREYKERLTDSRSKDYPDFITFQHENGEYYFAWVNDEEVLMRSEGYPSEAPRNNGLQSVIKNRDLEERYKLIESHGVYFMTLKAGNHQEIARSCPYKTEAAALALLPSERAKAAAVKKTVVKSSNDGLEDDYLICREYKERLEDSKSDKYPGFITFQHENGKYYFAYFDEVKNVLMRSEGYPSEAPRNNGIESVIKNREIPERFGVLEKHGANFIILKAGNHQEIARSCPFDDKAAADLSLAAVAPVLAAVPLVNNLELTPPVVEEVSLVNKIESTPPPVVEEIPVVAPKEKEDDYLACGEYKGHGNVDGNGIARFTHANGQMYFVWYDDKGNVILRSEGFQNEDDLQYELDMLLKHRENKDRYEIIEKNGLTMRILRDLTGREIGRSCLERIPAVPPVFAPLAAVAAVPLAAAALKKDEPEVVAAAAPIAAAPTAAGGFNWLWLLLPLLLLGLLFLLWRGCPAKTGDASIGTTTPKVETPTTTPTNPETPPTTPAETPTVMEGSGKVDGGSCNLNWIFYDYDKYNIRPDAETELDKLAAILSQNTDYTCKLVAFTDSKGNPEYNNRLSRKRYEKAIAYLAKKGIKGRRIKASAKGETNPIAKNTDTDDGRKFNRRVEIYVYDKAGKEVCASVPPVIPSDVK